MSEEYTERSEFPEISRRALADWHFRPGAFERLAPPWQDLETIDRYERLEEGARLVFEISEGPVSITWEARHEDVVEGEGFVDVQERGPFASWRHEHRFLERESGGSVLEDHVTYELPMGGLGELFGSGKARDELERMFTFRHERTAHDLRRHRTHGGRSLRVAISGASGMIGSSLAAFLTTGGHEVVSLVRHEDQVGEDAIFWKPSEQLLDPSDLEGFDAVVHLAGEPIAEGRWTASKKRRLKKSRVDGTRLIAETIAELDDPPDVLVSASAVGYYGDTGDREVDEGSDAGADFLAEVCTAWEEAADPARPHTRVVHPRIGLVTTAQGGFLPEMMRPFKLGAGGKLGSGDQYMSWIDLDDLLGIFLFLIRREDLEGPVNAVAPAPVTNERFTEVLGGVLGRPTFATVPSFALKIAMGSERAETMLLGGQRVSPTRLQEAGFTFYLEDLEEALRFTLGRS